MNKKRKKKTTIQIIGNIANLAILVFVACFALLVILSKLNTPLKIRLFSVLSGSMEPSLKVGSLVFVNPQNEYHVDDIITIQAKSDPNQTFTHRIHEIEKDEDLNKTNYQTKGDANEDPDPEPAPESRIIGKVIFSLPFAGKAISFAQTQVGFLILIIIPGTILIYSETQTLKKEIVKIIKKKKSEKKVKN